MLSSLKTFFVIVTLLSVVILSGCYYDTEETLYPTKNKTCDTTSVTYAGTIKPIMEQYCVGCHSGASASAGVELATYDGTKASGLDGSLYGSVAYDPNWSKMPKGGNQIESCAQTQIKIWVDAGCPNN
jgi:hypothetical protein